MHLGNPYHYKCICQWSPWGRIVNKERITQWKFPLHFIDFETSMMPLPWYRGRKPYEGIAFQYSHHVVDDRGKIAHQAMTLNSIAEKFHISRPAISQHVKILNECGILEIETIGRERFCKVQPKSLVPAFLWLEQYQKQWTERIDSFEKYVNKLQSKNKKQNK